MDGEIRCCSVEEHEINEELGFCNDKYGFAFKHTQILILIMCTNPPVEMLAHMLKVSKAGFLPNRG